MLHSHRLPEMTLWPLLIYSLDTPKFTFPLLLYGKLAARLNCVVAFVCLRTLTKATPNNTKLVRIEKYANSLKSRIHSWTQSQGNPLDPIFILNQSMNKMQNSFNLIRRNWKKNHAENRILDKDLPVALLPLLVTICQCNAEISFSVLQDCEGE